MIDEERAAIYEFDAGFTREEADEMARIEDVDRRKTLTKQQLDTLNFVKKHIQVALTAQDKNTKISIKQLIGKNLLKVDKEGWVSAIASE